MKHLLIGKGFGTGTSSIQRTHENFIYALKQIGSRWGIAEDAVVPNPKPVSVTHSYTLLHLTSFLSKGITGSVEYGNPEHNNRTGVEFNFFQMKFTPRNVAFEELFDHLGSYIVGLNLDQLELRKWQSYQCEESVGSSETLGWVFPVHFFSDEVARNSFGLSAQDIYRRLNKNQIAETVERFQNGVLIIKTRHETTFEEEQEFNLRVREVLGQS